MAHKNFNLDVPRLLDDAGGMDPNVPAEKQKRGYVERGLTDALNKASDVKGVEDSQFDTTAAEKLVSIMAAQATASGWSGGRTVDVATLESQNLLEASRVSTLPTDARMDDTVAYVIISKLDAEKDKLRDNVKTIAEADRSATPPGLGYTEFSNEVNAAYAKVMVGDPKDQLAAAVAFRDNLKQYSTNVKDWQKAYAKATDKAKTDIESGTSNTVAALATAIDAQVALKAAEKDSSKIPSGSNIDDMKRDAAAAADAFKTQYAGVLAIGSGNDALQGAITQIVHEKIQAEKTASLSKWSELSEEDKKSLSQGSDKKDIGLSGMIDKTIAERNLGVEDGQGLANPTIGGAGNSKSDGKGLSGGTAAVAALAVAGAALTLGGLKSGGQEEVDQATGEVTKKKGFMGKVVAALGVVTTVVAVAALIRGKDEQGFKDKIATGVKMNFGGRGA